MTAPTKPGMERREFIQKLAAGGFVLAIGSRSVRRLEAADAFFNPAAGSAFEPSVFLSIGEDNIVTVIVHRSEMGQGTKTGLVMAIADELEADWPALRVEQAIGDPKYGDQNTDGSTSIRNGSYMTFRKAGATARMMLEQAAAAEWGVPVSEVAGKSGKVVHAATKRSITYGKLVARAKALPMPKDVALKSEKDFRFIGKKMPGLDLRAVLTGKAIFAQDASMPGMKFAVIQRPPVYGSKVASFNAAASLKVKGVLQVIEVPGASIPAGMMPLGGIAVIATNTWAAIEGRKKLEITWTASPNDSFDTPSYRKELEASVRASGNTVRDLGDAAAALNSATKKIEAEYFAPNLAHAPMEPPAALAKVTGDKCEAWACTQDPQSARDTIGAMLKIPKENVVVHPTLLGGAFGRKSKPDFIAEAAWLSQKTGTPVKVIWTREDDLGNGFPVAFDILLVGSHGGLDERINLLALIFQYGVGVTQEFIKIGFHRLQCFCNLWVSVAHFILCLCSYSNWLLCQQIPKPVRWRSC